MSTTLARTIHVCMEACFYTSSQCLGTSESTFPLAGCFFDHQMAHPCPIVMHFRKYILCTKAMMQWPDYGSMIVQNKPVPIHTIHALVWAGSNVYSWDDTLYNYPLKPKWHHVNWQQMEGFRHLVPFMTAYWGLGSRSWHMFLISLVKGII